MTGFKVPHFFGNNRNHWKVRNHTNFPPKGSYMPQLAKMTSMFFVVCMLMLYGNLVLEIFRSPLFNVFLGEGHGNFQMSVMYPKS